MIVTRVPSRAYSWLSSSPTNPPPTVTSRSGRLDCSIAVVEVRKSAWASPGSGGMVGSLPVATR